MLSIPEDGWSLVADQSPGTPSTAITLHISSSTLAELKEASKTTAGLQFVSGKTTSIRFGKRILGLSHKSEPLTSELYKSEDNTSLTYVGNIDYQAKIKTAKDASNDDALLALQKSMAQIDDQKKASQTLVSKAIIAAPKNRYEADKQARNGTLAKLNPGKPGMSPASAVRSPALAPTSAYHDLTSPKTRALKHAITHLLAVRNLSTEEIAAKVRISSPELKPVLQTLAQTVDGKRKLIDKAYKELDVWRFRYNSEDDRKAVINNAIRAFDRLRLGKDDKLWQMLLPKEERGKGKVLSKLHGGVGASKVASPVPEGHTSSAVNTPRSIATPTLGANKKGVIDRLLSKDPKKARAVEEAKDKKRKERQAADSEERPAKRQATTTNKKTASAKSAEFVHSSSDEDKPIGKPAQATEKAHPVNGSKAHVKTSSQSREKPTSTHKTQSKTTSTGQLTPQETSQRAQISPPKAVRPTVPSPLGAAARKRVASDVSDRSGISQKRSVEGLGISTQRKRHDTVTGIETPKTHKAHKSVDMVQTRGGTDTSKAAATLKKRAAAPPTTTDGMNGHRKTASSTSASQSAHTQSSHSQQSPPEVSSDSSAQSIIDTITFEQGVDLAERFQDHYYPKYAALYDDIESRQNRGERVQKSEFNELMRLHARIKQMKAEIYAASTREHTGDES